MLTRSCLIAAVLAAGCSTATPPLPCDQRSLMVHPANPDAAEASPSAGSDVLNLDKADSISPGGTQPSAASPQHEHGDHP